MTCINWEKHHRTEHFDEKRKIIRPLFLYFLLTDLRAVHNIVEERSARILKNCYNTSMNKSTFLYLFACSSVSAFSFLQSSNARIAAERPRVLPAPIPSIVRSNKVGTRMFLGQSMKKLEKKADTTIIGTSTVPSIGIGTISWSSNSRK